MSEVPDPVSILHVDDDPDVTELTAIYLKRERERFSVRSANSAADGLERLAGGAVDCIVSDFDMPGTDGIEFLEAVREDFPELPFILYTGKGSEEVASEAISAGVTDYLQKEAGADHYTVLANRIENAVERYRTEKALDATRRRYEKIVENNLAGIYIIQDGEFVYVNPKLAEIHGYPRDEIIGMSPLELVAPAERERVATNLQKRLDGEVEEIQYQTLGLRNDGERIEIELHGSRIEYGSTPAIIGAELDISDRKERERELERYEAIVENTNDGVFVFDEECRFEFVNQRVAEVADIPRADWIGRHVSMLADRQLVSEAEVQAVEDDLRKIIDGEETEVRITLQPQFPTDIRYLELRLTPLRTDDGQTYAIGFSRDVTEQRERTGELQREIDLRAALFENATSPVMEVTYEGELPVISRVNPAFEEIFGHAADEVVGRHVGDVVVPESEREQFEQLKDRVLAGERVETEVKRQTATGIRDFMIQVIPIEIGEVSAGAYAWYVDITAHEERTAKVTGLHEVATELEACETRTEVYERLVEAAESVLHYDLATVDTVHGNVLQPEAVSSGATSAYEDQTPLSTDENLAASVYRTGETAVVDDLRTRGVTPARSEYRAVLTVPIGDFGVFQAFSTEPGRFDETDREYAELLCDHARQALANIEHRTALQRQNERLEEFTSVTSHDLRNPLNTAAQRLSLAQETCESEHLDALQDSLDRMESLIDSLLTLSREGEDVGDLESVELGAAIEQSWQNVVTGEATLEVETEGTLRADRSRFRQLLENLIRNAVEHGSTSPRSSSTHEDAVEHGGETVRITVGRTPSGFFVEDDGPGIPDAERDSVLDAGYSTSEEGTGFGLAIVKQIAIAHGWSVEVTESDAGGARFEFGDVEFTDG